MCGAAECIDRSSGSLDDKQLYVATMMIVDHEAAFLRSMDQIVYLMEREAAAAVVRLRICAAAIAVAIVVLLVGLGWFVIRPATMAIRNQLSELESAVAARTRDVRAALTALQLEVKERDLSDLRSQQLAAHLAHADRVSSLGHLAAGLAHELNHPLATIANYAEACDIELAQMPKDVRTDRLSKYFDRAKQAALRAGGIVRQMRNFVCPGSTPSSCVELETLIHEVVEFCLPEVTRAGAELSLELEDRHAVVEVEPIRIQQVLVNLIQNGLQAMRDTPSDRRRLIVRSTVIDKFV
jgi:C4-dicarboxylate-specific signal transduction histidine kinase